MDLSLITSFVIKFQRKLSKNLRMQQVRDRNAESIHTVQQSFAQFNTQCWLLISTTESSPDTERQNGSDILKPFNIRIL